MPWMKYRKKPVVIDACEITDAFFDDPHPNPDHEHLAAVTIVNTPSREVEIRTLEGVMIGKVGDFLIRGVNGELYPCKPDIFAKTYEAVDGGDAGSAAQSIVSTNRCARCGSDHGPVRYERLSRPVSRNGLDEVYTHWAVCPTTGEPILLHVAPGPS